MKQAYLLLLFWGILLFPYWASAQNTLVEISGQVKDGATKTPLSNATVYIRENAVGATTDSTGYFVIKSYLRFPFTLEITFVGYEKQVFTVENERAKLQFQLQPLVMMSDEMVVTASRVEERLSKSPVAIEKLDIRAIRETPAPSFYDALENVKGVQLTTSSLTFKVPNTRGFNNPNNFRFMQLVDGVDVQAATLGVPLGNTIGPSELDIAAVEITPGSASALYGINSINGLAHLRSKNPFLTQGFSFYQRVGVNHVDNIDHDAALMTETALRFAKVLDKNEKLAVKLNVSYFQGIDWVSSAAVDQNSSNKASANPAFPELGSGLTNPAYDAWNRYGDERNNNVSVAVNYLGKRQTFNVRRTGYWEKDLTEPQVSNLKFSGGLFYKLSKDWEINYNYRYGSMDGTFQRGNKIRLNDAVVQNHALELKNKRLTARIYFTDENTGDSYNLKPLVDNLDLTNKSNKDWTALYQTTLQSAIDQGKSLTDAHLAARVAADQGRAQPGTAAFQNLKNTIININNWDHASLITGAPATGGAALWQRSHLYHGDLQYDASHWLKDKVNVLVGADLRVTEVIPDGNNFVDFSRPLEERNLPGGDNVRYSKLGAFVQATKLVFDDKLKLVGSIRYDHNYDFPGRWNPRVAAVYSPNEKWNYRVSYQSGVRFPALFEALSYVNNGNVRRVGGLAKVNEGLGFLENSYTLNSLDLFTAAVNKDVAGGLTRNDAALKNRALLAIANLPQLAPEEVQAWDAGVKSVFFNNKVVLDWDFYYNIYNGFLGQVEVAVPVDGKVGTDASVLNMLDRNKQVRYRVFTNATNTYYNYGSALRLSYNFYKKYSLSGNLNYNDLQTKNTNDIFITGFNTPTWSGNIQFGNREVLPNFGFNVVWKWQDSFLWQTPLAEGTVSSFSTVDAQVSLQVPKWNASFKLGGTNLANNRYIQYAAGPTIGALYYLSVTWDIWKK